MFLFRKGVKLSSSTERLKLFKYDVEQDAKSTFNIEESLNNNWDKIDKFAKQAQFVPFCFNAGVVASNGNAACLTLKNNTLTLLSGSVGTTAGGTTYTVPKDVSIDISGFGAGEYNLLYDTENQSIEKYNSVIKQPTQPANFRAGDIWLDDSVMPWTSKMKNSDGKIVAREIIPLPAKLVISTVSDGGGGGAALMPNYYNNNGLEQEYLPITGGTIKGPLIIERGSVPQLSLISDNVNGHQPNIYGYNNYYDKTVIPQASENLSLGRLRIFDKNQQDVGAWQVYRDIVNKFTSAQMYVTGCGANAANKSASLSVGVNDDGSFRSAAPHVTNAGGIVTQAALNKSAQGYLKLGNGIILQWGQANDINTTWKTFTFPTAFATRMTGFGYVNIGQQAGENYGIKLNSQTLTKTNFQLTTSTAPLSVLWFAIGY